MSSNADEPMDDFDAARRSILHVKCSVLKKYYNQMKAESYKHRPPKVGRLRRVMDADNFGFIGKLWWALLAYWLFDMFLAMIRFRCTQFGGTKCRFPFDLVPDWMTVGDFDTVLEALDVLIVAISLASTRYWVRGRMLRFATESHKKSSSET